MEKKSIGSFISALRKANGMSQKELAEKLNVSDKSVSRWERDENLPDLTLVPVIAEIFGVTADELLRGERVKPQEAGNTEGGAKAGAEKENRRTEKQLMRLLNDTKTKFHVRSMVSICLGIVGLLTAMICNFAFYRAYIGFFAACIFYVVAVVCEIIFYELAVSAVTGGEFDGGRTAKCRKDLFLSFEKRLFVMIVLFAFTLPLALFPIDGYEGIAFVSWIGSGAFFAAGAALLCVLLSWAAGAYAVQKGIVVLSEKEAEANRRLGKLRGKCFGICAALLLVTALGQFICNASLYATDLVEGNVFDNWEEFRTYMETPAEAEADGSDFETIDMDDDTLEDYREYATADKAPEYSYLCLNREVAEIEWGETDNGLLPITVYTNAQILEGKQILNQINVLIIGLYLAECAACIFVYNVIKGKR